MPAIDPQNLAASLDRLRNAGDDDIYGAIDRTVTACVDLFGVEGSGLMIADEQNTLRYVVTSDGPGRVLEEVQSHTGQGPCVDTYVHGWPVHTDDLAVETRWPQSRRTILDHGVRAVLGVPVNLRGTTVGSLDVYRDHAHAWDDSEREALVHYSLVIEATLRTVLAAHGATELAAQLQYALDNRVLIERAVGFVMASADADAVTASPSCATRPAATGARSPTSPARCWTPGPSRDPSGEPARVTGRLRGSTSPREPPFRAAGNGHMTGQDRGPGPSRSTWQQVATLVLGVGYLLLGTSSPRWSAWVSRWARWVRGSRPVATVGNHPRSRRATAGPGDSHPETPDGRRLDGYSSGVDAVAGQLACDPPPSVDGPPRRPR